MSNKSGFLTSILILFSTCLFAQENLCKGFVLLNNQDTIPGFIDNHSYYINSLVCDFYKDEHSSKTQYLPGSIKGYAFRDGKYYISKVVKVADQDSCFFLEYLIDGKLDVFFRQDWLARNFYYAANDSSRLVELEYSKQIIELEGKRYMKESKPYIKYLAYLTNDDPQIQQQIRDMGELSHKPLKRLAAKYHNDVCRDSECIVYEKNSSGLFSLDAEIGFKYFSKKFNDDKFYIDMQTSGPKPFFGFNFLFTNPSFSEKWFMGLGFIYEGKSDPDAQGRTFTNFRIPVSYGYSPAGKGLKPYCQTRLSIRNYAGEKFTSMSFAPGMKYNFKKCSVTGYLDIEFASMFILPLAYMSTGVGAGVIFW